MPSGVVGRFARSRGSVDVSVAFSSNGIRQRKTAPRPELEPNISRGTPILNRRPFAKGLLLLGLAVLSVLLAGVAPAPAQTGAGATFVPLDSWVYPALDRLRALGYTHSQFLNLRPWTRGMCAKLVHEVQQSLNPDDPEGMRLYRALEQEFTPELALLNGGTVQDFTVDSLYGRVEGISGSTLHDSWHFGQTIANDFGRPFGEGVNAITGFSARGQQGRFFIAVRGEYQHAPSIPGYDSNVQAVIEKEDNTKTAPLLQPFAQRDQFRLLDTYVGVVLGDWELSFGKQSLWYGPGLSGPLLFSDNVNPPYMLRLDQTNPVRLPGFGKWLGELRSEFFFAKLSGHSFPPRPFLHGEKISVKPTDNLEFGFNRMTVFLGEGNGFTMNRLLRSYLSVGDNPGSNRSNSDPGDRKGGFDVSYRVPGVRNWLTFYVDSFTDDDPLPLAAPWRAAWNPGIYLAKVPGLPNLDFRIEGLDTDVGSEAPIGHLVYYNGVYKDSYTQNGFIIGNTIGRGGRGVQAWSTYWFTARNSIQAGFRTTTTDPVFIPGGGGQKDFNLRADWLVRSNVQVSAFAQYEHWSFPLIANMPQHDVAAWLQVSVDPNWKWGHSRSAAKDQSVSHPSTDELLK